LLEKDVRPHPMLKIEWVRMVDGRPKLRVEGRVIGPWVAELQLACERALGEGAGLALDLQEVAFVDHTGVEFLCMLGQQGVVLDCSAFVAEQLRARGWR